MKKTTLPAKQGNPVFSKSWYAVLSLLLLFCSNVGLAQVTSYSFTQTADAYNPISGGTVLWTGYDGFDDNSTTVTLPNAFVFQGVSYTSLFVSANGYVLFGSTSTTNTPISSGRNAVAAFAADLDAKSASAGTGTPEVRWEQVANEFVLQWSNVCRYGTSGATTAENLNFQIRLNTATGAIKIVYGACVDRVAPLTTVYPQVGLGGGSAAVYRNRAITAGAGDWINSTAGTVNTDTMAFNGTTIPSNGLTYTWTPPSCLAPTGLTSANLTLNSATISWTASISSPTNGYEYEVRTSGAAGSGATGLVASGTTSGLSAPISGLSASTTYTFYVRSDCGAGDFSGWSSSTFYTGYCQPSSTSSATFINNFSTTGGATNISNLGSGYTTGGYQDNYNTATVSQYATGTINFASDITGGSVGTSIWVDWNNDLVFDNATERVFVTASYGYNQTGSFTVPNGTALGDYRMRIRIDYNSSTPDACSNANTRTEAEDYKLTVIAQPSCLAPTGLTAIATSVSTATLNWTASVSNPTEGYDYYVSASNVAPTAGTTPSGSVTAGTVTALVSGLTASTTYYVWLRSNCGSGNTSVWTSNTVSFYTGYCVPSSTSNATFINNFSTTGGTTNISNLGSGYTTGGYQDNYNTATVSQYATGTINFASDITGGSVGTSIWVDWNNDLVFDNATERVFVTTAYGFNQTGSFTVPNGTALGDYRMRVRIDYNAIAPDACSNTNTRTEAEDYKLTVIAQPSCLVPSGLTAVANTAFTATLNWTASTSNPTEGYDYYVSDSNVAPTAGTTPSGNVTAGNVTALASGLNPLTTYYVWVRSNCGSGDTSVWTSATVSFMTPCDPAVITSTTPGSVCGQGTVDLAATASDGTIKWYAAETGGNALATGTTFTTPSITTTTSYWAETNVLGSTQTSGKAAPEAAATTSTTNNWGIVFNATSPVQLQTVSVYSTAAGTINIKVTNAALTELYSTGDIAVAAGGTTTPNVIPINFAVPAGNGYRILVKATSGVSLVRDNSAVTFPYNGTDGVLNVVSSEWGGTTTANYYYFYDVKYSSICTSARTEVVATVTAPPALTLSTNNTAAVCSGETSAPVTITAGDTDYDTFTWSPATGVSGDAVNGWVFNPSETTVYTLTASQSSGSLCVATTDVTVTINPNPVVNASASNTVFCEGGSTVLTAVTETSTPGTITVGTATTLTGATSQPTAFCNRWAQYWNQTIFTAAELQALGLRAGNITSISYTTTTMGDGTNVGNFTISLGTTANTTVSSFTTTGLSTVYGPTTYNHSVGVNTLVFDTPYVWDGVSNIIVDIRQTGADSINNAVTYYTATPSAMTISAITSTTLATNSIQNLVAASSVTPTTSTQRLNVVLGGQVGGTGAGNLDWTWNPGALTGNSVTVYPSASTTYTVRGTNPSTGCYTEQTVDVTVNAAPAPTGDSVQTFAVNDLSEATVADLVAVGNNIQWYASEEDAMDDVNELASTTQLVSGATYYAVQTTAEGCRSVAALAVTVTVTLGNDSFELAGLKYYPNPVTNALNIDYSSNITTVEVYNTLGQKIASKNVNAISTSIDMARLASGTYFVKVQTENASRTIKVVKN